MNFLPLRFTLNELELSVSETAHALLNNRRHIRLLEAGCGSISQIAFNMDAHAVGIDISLDQLQQNRALHERILGDIQDYPLPTDSFDVVVSWMVLEHLSRPLDALRNLFGAVKPEGLLILGFPNLLSIKGLVTKISPFWFTRLFYRIMNYTSPHFPTYLRLSILPTRVIRFAETNGFTVEFYRMIEGAVAKKVRRRYWFMDIAFSLIDSFTRIISLNTLPSPLLDNCAIILRKRNEDHSDQDPYE